MRCINMQQGQMAYDKVEWHDLLDTVIILPVPHKARNSSTSETDINFLERIQYRGLNWL
jgi:hypothetical protein